VLQFDQARGYGFIAAEDGGEDIFLHASVFDGDPDKLVPGLRVEFQVMAGDRGRKAFAAHPVTGEPGSEPVLPPPAAPSAPRAQPLAGPGSEEDQMCDVLSQAEFGQELTELLLHDVPTLTGQQILGVRRAALDFARKHGWVDI